MSNFVKVGKHYINFDLVSSVYIPDEPLHYSYMQAGEFKYGEVLFTHDASINLWSQEDVNTVLAELGFPLDQKHTEPDLVSVGSTTVNWEEETPFD